MELRQLEAVREVVATGSVTAAAAVLHCTPSAVSQQLRAAERLAGTALVEKDGRGIRPTAAGRALAARAAEVALAVERARTAVEEFAGRPTGTVRVAAFQSAAELLFPPLLAAMAAHEGITVECVEADVAQEDFIDVTARAEVVVAHRPDRSAPFVAPDLHVTRLLREPLDVAVPPGHRLAGHDGVTPADLVGETWISVHEGFPIAGALHELEARTGRPFDIRHRINDFHVIEALVASGEGVALLPRFAAGSGRDPRLRLLPLRGLRAGRLVEALARADRAERRVVRTVLRELREQAAVVASSNSS